MTGSIYLHGCSDIIAEQHMPSNQNSIKLRVLTGSYEMELVLFGLSEDTTDALLDAIGRKPPPDFRDDQDEIPVKRPYVIHRDPDSYSEDLP